MVNNKIIVEIDREIAAWWLDAEAIEDEDEDITESDQYGVPTLKELFEKLAH